MNLPNAIHPMDKLHQQAMELADRAYSAERKGQMKNVQQFYEKAFELEKAAAMHLVSDFTLEPTRSVYFRSAASLILSLPRLSYEQFREGERMVAFGLSGNPPVVIADELREVQEELKVKYYQQQEIIAKGKVFSTTGKFVALNLKTRQFEFIDLNNQVIKGSYTKKLLSEVQNISFVKGYIISGWAHFRENVKILNELRVLN